MATRTIDLLLNLETKPTKSIDQLKKDLQSLEKEAGDLTQALDLAMKEGSRGAPLLASRLKQVKGEIKAIDAEAKKRNLEKALKAAGDQANKTREKMDKLAQVGSRIAIAGAAILAPFTLAFKKYLELADESDPTAQRLKAMGAEFQELQVRIGKLVAESILPMAERVLPMLERAVTFMEANPGIVQAALGLGATLATAGAVLATAAQVAQTIATVKGLAAGAGLVQGGGAAAGAVGGTGLAAALAPALVTALQVAGVIAAIIAAAEGTRLIVNAITGQNQTWSDIGNTVKQLTVIMAEGWDGIFAFFGMDTNFSRSVADALGVADIATNYQTTENAKQMSSNISNSFNTAVGLFSQALGGALAGGFSAMIESIYSLPTSIGSTISSAIAGVITGAQADGGYASTNGLYLRGEQGREFVMNNGATRAAESIIGGRLTQENLLAALGGGSRRITYNDHRRIDSSLSARDRRVIRNDVVSAIAGAL